MPVDPSPLIACASTWRANRGWAETLREPYALLKGGATGLEAAAAWAQVAMMFGDTRGAPLALVVCVHAERELGVEHERLAAHRQLCMLDLGLASAPGPVRLGDLGKEGTVEERAGHLDAWLARALMPFDGDVARAAHYALELAAVRLGLVEGSEPTP
jgi:hypothetical protein